MSQLTAFSKELWRSHLWRWLVPLLVVVSMAGLLTFYRAVYSGRVAQLERQYEAEVETLAKLGGERAEVNALADAAEQTRAGIVDLYTNRFASEQERLTSLLREVKDLAARSGLSPNAISYPETAIEEQGLVRKNIEFSVQGGYTELRRLINFLELSDSFIVLESIGVSEGEAGTLSISLSLSTIFTRDDSDLAPATVAGGGR
jgi:Tfp pilus assembly protein PilO